MENELLPEWLNIFLDNVETALSPSILCVIVFCTLQFIVNHAMNIGYTVYESMKSCTNCMDEDEEKTESSSIVNKVKDMLYGLAYGKSNPEDEEDCQESAMPPRTNSQEEEWDYCEEDED